MREPGSNCMSSGLAVVSLFPIFSPIAADNKVYITNEDGENFLLLRPAANSKS